MIRLWSHYYWMHKISPYMSLYTFHNDHNSTYHSCYIGIWGRFDSRGADVTCLASKNPPKVHLDVKLKCQRGSTAVETTSRLFIKHINLLVAGTDVSSRIQEHMASFLYKSFSSLIFQHESRKVSGAQEWHKGVQFVLLGARGSSKPGTQTCQLAS